jgi:hypothetical protein
MSDDIGKAGSDETKAALQAMYATGGGHHATRVNGRVVDGARAASGVQYANSGKGVEERRENAWFKRTGTLTADVTIEQGEEILVPWGEFWPPYRRTRAAAETVHITDCTDQPDNISNDSNTKATCDAQEQIEMQEQERRMTEIMEGRQHTYRDVGRAKEHDVTQEELGNQREETYRQEAGRAHADGERRARDRVTEEAKAAASIQAAHDAAEHESAMEEEARAGAEKRAAEAEQQRQRRRKEAKDRQQQHREKMWTENRQRALERRKRDRQEHASKEAQDVQQEEDNERNKRRRTSMKRRPPREWETRARSNFVRRATSREQERGRHNDGDLRHVCSDGVT